MSALGLCPWVHDCDDPNYSIRIRIAMYKINVTIFYINVYQSDVLSEVKVHVEQSQ